MIIQTDQINKWYPADRPPTFDFEKRNDLKFLAELESGHLVSAEYDKQVGVYVAYCQRFDKEHAELLQSGALTPELVDEILDWESEETTEVVRWMWIFNNTDDI